jgi:hypothetical protein
MNCILKPLGGDKPYLHNTPAVLGEFISKVLYGSRGCVRECMQSAQPRARIFTSLSAELASRRGMQSISLLSNQLSVGKTDTTRIDFIPGGRGR